MHLDDVGGSHESTLGIPEHAAASGTAIALSRRVRASVGALLLLALAVVFANVPQARAQGLGGGALPSADQIQIFQSLSPDQQDAILKQLGGAGGSAAAGSGLQDPFGRRLAGANDQDQTRSQDDDARTPAIPIVKGDDWVIIEADFHLPPRPVSQSLQSLYGAQGVPSPQSLQALQGAVASGALGQPPVAAGATAQQPDPASQRPALTDAERKTLSDMMSMIRLRNPYRLSRDGVLTLPGFQGIALLGLTEDQATLRLKAQPDFHDIDIRVTLLPLKKSGVDGLKPFGYDLFSKPAATFSPVTNVPVPADYVVGAGDELEVQLYGNQNRTLKLTVGRDGRVNFPELGPINVVGQRFSDVKAGIESRITREIIGVRASVSLGETRSIRVFVLGEARHPGSYTISGLGTITSALFAAGGVETIGSLRNIELKRQGTLVRTLDLYDMLIRGDTTDDTKLLPGDVIFVPPVGTTVAVSGEVRRPAIYEIKREANVADLLQLAGGLTSEADRSTATLTRIDEKQQRVVLQVDPSQSTAAAQRLRNGDWLQINRLRPTLDSGILVQGHVFNQVAFAYRPGIRLSDVIHSVDELQPNADIHYLLIRRELPPDRRVAVLSADLDAALRAPGSAADVPLMARDQITVFDLVSGRERVIQPLMVELRTQSSMSQPAQLVHVDGRVKVPGEYPLEPGMTIADLVRAGGGLADSAYSSSAELTRYQVSNGDARRTQLIDVSLATALSGDARSNIRLQPFDDLTIKEVPEWGSREAVTLVGEVRFPGRYSIRRGETLRSVVARAGGLTEYAFPEGALFSREELKKREQEQIDMLATRMQRDLAVLALQGAAANQTGATAALSVGQSLLAQLRSAKAVGRLVISLPQTMTASAGSASDVILRNNDELVVPRFEQEVTVIGEVQNATSHLFRPGLDRDDYIELSGGMTSRADRSKIYVVHANGSVVASSGSRWFQLGTHAAMKPGDTVVVPLDAEHIPALPFWQAATTILYNVAFSAAALHSF